MKRNKILSYIQRSEPNRIDHEFAVSEIFQYFDILSYSVRLNQNSVLLHLNDFFLMYLFMN